MKSLVTILLLVVGNTAFAQNVYSWPNSPWNPPTCTTIVSVVPVVQPMVVQEVRFVPFVENRIVYQPIWPVYQQPGVWPVYQYRPYRPRGCGWWNY